MQEPDLKFDFSEILESQPSLGISGVELGHLMIRLTGNHYMELRKKLANTEAITIAAQLYSKGIIDVVEALTEFGLLPKYVLSAIPPEE